MEDRKVLYTILSVLALTVVIISIVFAYQAYNEEIKNNNTLVE